METIATGVCIDPSGLVSLYHCFDHEGAEVYGRPYRDGYYDYDIRRLEAGHMFKVSIVKTKPAYDLVRLKVERVKDEKPKEKSEKKARKKDGNGRLWYSKLVVQSDLSVGQKLIHMGHLETSTSYINYPTPPCEYSSCRTVKLYWHPHGYRYRVGEEYPEKKILVITTHCCDSGWGNSGSPLFNAYGGIVGLLKGSNDSESDQIYVVVLREFIEVVKAVLN